MKRKLGRIVVLATLARMLFKDYGADAYRAFVRKNPLAAVPSIEKRIDRP